MPIHDWTRVEAGDFHHFHQTWIPFLAAALNGGGLPPGFMAMAEQVTGRPIPDVVTLQFSEPRGNTGGVALAAAPAPSARVIRKLEPINYARRADRVVIRHGRGKVVAIIEIVSPGNKSSQHAIRSFVEKAADILTQGIHLVVVDVFPPTPRDPQGLHKAIWDQFEDEPFDFLPDKPLTVASYVGGDMPTAYVESVGVGDRLPAIPLFLTEFDHVPCPLDPTYEQAWAVFPAMLKEIIELPR
ncbi:MAG TPA: DUF4058 family protein [Tepidisphaeraceae bacterium]|jgi:hypothetical protein|nr:DUF4058 family protein [Tepidisphaeraceae bacterium]